MGRGAMLRTAFQEGAHRDPGLQAGERGTQAEVDAVAEGDMAAGVAGDVEAVGVVEAEGVASGVGDHGEHDLAATGDHRAGDVDRVEGEAEGGGLQRSVVAQHLLDRAVDEGQIGAQRGELLRVGEQRQHAVGDEIAGGLVAGDQQQLGHAQEFFVAEPVAVPVAHRDQIAQQIVAGVRALGLHQVVEVAGHGREDFLGPRRGGADHQDVGPGTEGVPLQEGHTQ